jgi:hypothetical protein
LSTLGVWCEDVSIVIEVADVKELVVGEAVSAPELEVRLDVIEVAESGGEFDVRCVVEAGVAKDADPVLGWFVNLFSRSNVVTIELANQAEQIYLGHSGTNPVKCFFWKRLGEVNSEDLCSKFRVELFDLECIHW